MLEEIIYRIDYEHRTNAGTNDARRRELERRRQKEKAAMAVQQGKDWGDLAKINVGRQTGSVEWRRIRGELGSAQADLEVTSVFERTFDAPIFQPAFASLSATNVTVSPNLKLPHRYSLVPYYNRPAVTVEGVKACLGIPGVNVVCIHPVSHTIMAARSFDLMRSEGGGDKQDSSSKSADKLAAFLDSARVSMVLAIVTVSTVVAADGKVTKIIKDRFGVDVRDEVKFGILAKPDGVGTAFCKGNEELDVLVDRRGWSGEWGWMELRVSVSESRRMSQWCEPTNIFCCSCFACRRAS